MTASRSKGAQRRKPTKTHRSSPKYAEKEKKINVQSTVVQVPSEPFIEPEVIEVKKR